MNCSRKVLVLVFFLCKLFTTFASKNVTQQSSTPSGNLTTEDVFPNSTDVRRRMVWHCDTVDGKAGYCMPLKNCSALLNLSSDEKRVSLVRDSTCEIKRNNRENPLVCCSKIDIHLAWSLSAAAATPTTLQKSEKVVKPRSCGYQNITILVRIMGGIEASLGEFPWMARLYHKDQAGTKTFGCSGFLIAQKFVLTAAHCLYSEMNKIYGPVREVQLGEHNTKTAIDCDEKNTTCAEKVQIIRVNKTIVHPLYDANSRHHHNDIGLIYLNKGAKLCTYVSPICLVEQEFNVSEYWLSGWGATRDGGGVSSIKLKVAVPPFPHTNCTKQYKIIGTKITDTQLCAGGRKNEDSCTGDSGGPLMAFDGNHWSAVGVVSYGLSCGREGWPAVYTKITNYTEWIKNTMLEVSKENKSKNTERN